MLHKDIAIQIQKWATPTLAAFTLTDLPQDITETQTKSPGVKQDVSTDILNGVPRLGAG